ncbi:MAG: hypothetical protein AB1730_14670 [Myxococcota bacterium]|jgi:hypothetical protein
MAKKLGPPALVLHALLLVWLAVLYGGDLVRYVRAGSAEVAWMNTLPNLGLALAGVAALLLGGGLLGYGLARGLDASWRGYRLGPIAGVLLLFFDFAVLASVRSPVSSAERALLAVVALADGASQHASHTAVPDEPKLLASFVDDLGAVPFFSKGERVASWTVDVRRGCSGPAADAAGKGAGTLIYCLAPDGKRAWVTLVGLAPGEIFGTPRVVGTEDPWMQEVTVAEPAPAPRPEAPPRPELGTGDLGDVWQLPTPDDQADSGR